VEAKAAERDRRRAGIELKGHTNSIGSAVFSPDGKKIVTASDDQTARIWDAKSGKMLRTFSGHTNVVQSAFFSPDAKKIATADTDKTVQIWNVESGRLLQTLEDGFPIFPLDPFSPDGKKIVTAGTDKTVQIWDAESGKLLRTVGTVQYEDQSRLDTGGFSADGKRLVTQGWARENIDTAQNIVGSVAGGWSDLGLISLDKCIGYTRNIGIGQLAAWLASNQATLDEWAENVLGLSGADRDKAYLIDEVNLKVIRCLSGAWVDDGTGLNPALDAMHDAENTTHYADIQVAETALDSFGLLSDRS
jgi:uncharacterized protein with WD repeat